MVFKCGLYRLNYCNRDPKIQCLKQDSFSSNSVGLGVRATLLSSILKFQDSCSKSHIFQRKGGQKFRGAHRHGISHPFSPSLLTLFLSLLPSPCFLHFPLFCLPVLHSFFSSFTNSLSYTLFIFIPLAKI